MDSKANERYSILIVDDEDFNLTMLGGILGDEYDVRTASSGREALEKALNDPPDLILLDVMMPGMDGYETLDALKREEKTWSIPVIYITGLDSKEDERRGLELSAVDYISKPLSPSIVKLRVNNQIQIIKQIRTIETLSLIDQLTAIPNRRNLDNRFAIEWSRAFREKMPISLLMMDIDKFKVFNDTYGHLTGDEVLKMVAASITSSLKRKSDFAARYGGEEFSVLLPNTSKEGAVDIAERIRRNIEKLVIPCGDGKTTRVTMSIGIHTAVPGNYEVANDFVSKADQALYTAKETGRNRVCVYGEQPPANNTAGIESTADNLQTASDTAAAHEEIPTADDSFSSDAAPGTDIMKKLETVNGINTEAGMNHFQKMESLYIDTVKSFYDRIPGIISEMDNALAAGDIKMFTISVHSVKSMLSTVGGMSLSRKAAKLEIAGKEDDTEYCQSNYPELKTALSAMHTQLTDIFAPPAAPMAPQVTGRRKIIHVDDVTYTLVSLKGRLEKHYEIYSVRTHEKLFKLLERLIPDMILLDVNMPGMDGYEIIGELKADPRYKDIPVAFFTSIDDEKSIRKCKEMGAADVIIKPIPDAELIKRISDTMK